LGCGVVAEEVLGAGADDGAGAAAGGVEALVVGRGATVGAAAGADDGAGGADVTGPVDGAGGLLATAAVPVGFTGIWFPTLSDAPPQATSAMSTRIASGDLWVRIMPLPLSAPVDGR
jgi:hypothetical protein